MDENIEQYKPEASQVPPPQEDLTIRAARRGDEIILQFLMGQRIVSQTMIPIPVASIVAQIILTEYNKAMMSLQQSRIIQPQIAMPKIK